MTKYVNLFFSVYLYIFLIFIFITIFFWTVIRNTETNHFHTELEKGIKEGLKSVRISKDVFKDSQVDYLKSYFSGKDSKREMANNNLLTMNIVIIVLIGIGLFSSYFVRYFFCKENIDWKHIIIENIIVLVVVAAVQYFFFTNIASQYVQVMPSYLPNTVKRKINEINEN